MIRALLTTALLAAPIPAMAQNEERVCTAVAKGSRDAQVTVVAEVDGDGDIWSRSVRWTPPMLDASPPRYRDLDRPELVLQYDDAEAGAIGELTEAVGEISSVGGPAGALRQLTLLLWMDSGESWSVELEPSGVAYRIGGSPFRYASASITDGGGDGDPYERLETGTALTLLLQDAMGRPVAQARYDIGARAERDRLFRSAWRKSEAMARNPKHCDKADDG